MPAATQSIAASAPDVRIRETDSDSALITRFLAGDSTAFEQLFLKYRDYVYNISYQMVGNPDDASDLTQETFFRVWRALPHFQGNSQFSTWLYRIAVNACISEIRKRPKTPTLSLEDEENVAPLHATHDHRSAEQAVMRRFGQERIRDVVSTLPSDYRTVIVLRHFHDLSYQEIADAMGCTVGAIKIKLHRARKLFRSRYLKSAPAEEFEGFPEVDEHDPPTAARREKILRA